MNFITPFLAGAPEFRQRFGRPFVTLSYAQSLDGCISVRPGEALALSGRQSLRLTHQLRAGHQAILVGIGTVISDNPRLTVRYVNGVNPRPIIVDSRLRLPLDCNLVTGKCMSPWVVTQENPDPARREALENAGVTVLEVPSNDEGQINLATMLERLADMGINSVMVEGGARIITNVLLERLADFLVLTVAPVLVGGLRAVSDLGQSDPANFVRIENRGYRWLGEDLILWGQLSLRTES